jgi:hypothetical protein
MGRKNKQRRKQKELNRKSKPIPSHSKSRKPTLADFDIDPRISSVGISVIQDAQGIRVATDTQYSVQDEPNGLIVVKTIPQNLIDKIKAVSSPFTFAGKVNKKHADAAVQQSWPQQWSYLTEPQRKDLEQSLINPQFLMMGVISHLQFGAYIYTTTHIQRFLDSYTEIAWIDYVIRQQLRAYDGIYDPKYVTTGFSFEFNPQVAACWLTLENCIIRIAGMWDRLIEFLVPLYFFGQTYEEILPTLTKPYKADLARRISALPILNSVQKTYFDLLVSAVVEYEGSSFKNLRNRVVHEFVYRPEGIVPTESDTIPTPATIEELHTQVLEQLSKVREAVIIFTAIMLHKYPTNSIAQVET